MSLQMLSKRAFDYQGSDKNDFSRDQPNPPLTRILKYDANILRLGSSTILEDF